MIELRWLERHFEWDHECDGKTCVERILQYREGSYIYDDLARTDDPNVFVRVNNRWAGTEWQDVPTVKAIPT